MNSPEFQAGAAARTGTSLDQVGAFAAVPLFKLPVESPIVEPPPSLRPQRPMRFGADVISASFVVWICACVRATFQIRASSMIPWKKPAATPADVIAVPIAACWIDVDSGVAVTA